jgi:hypothetical protein
VCGTTREKFLKIAECFSGTPADAPRKSALSAGIRAGSKKNFKIRVLQAASLASEFGKQQLIDKQTFCKPLQA